MVLYFISEQSYSKGRIGRGFCMTRSHMADIPLYSKAAGKLGRYPDEKRTNNGQIQPMPVGTAD